MERLSPDNATLAAEIASLPLTMRGFGHVKAASIRAAEGRQADLMSKFLGLSVAR